MRLKERFLFTCVVNQTIAGAGTNANGSLFTLTPKRDLRIKRIEMYADITTPAGIYAELPVILSVYGDSNAFAQSQYPEGLASSGIVNWMEFYFGKQNQIDTNYVLQNGVEYDFVYDVNRTNMAVDDLIYARINVEYEYV